MAALRVFALGWLVLCPLSAGTIDVTRNTSVAMPMGNNLLFTFAERSFAVNAINFGLPGTPSNVTFSFLAAAGLSGEFVAILESPDAAATARLAGTVQFMPGSFQGAKYEGPVSIATGTFVLTPGEAERIFANGYGVLDLINIGNDLTVGLPPYTIGQDLTVTVGGSGLTVGAPVLGVLLDPPGPVPEPAGAATLGAALTFCAVFAAWRRRMARAADGRRLPFNPASR